jgi:hypothetical protein
LENFHSSHLGVVGRGGCLDANTLEHLELMQRRP